MNEAMQQGQNTDRKELSPVVVDVQRNKNGNGSAQHVQVGNQNTTVFQRGARGNVTQVGRENILNLFTETRTFRISFKSRKRNVETEIVYNVILPDEDAETDRRRHQTLMLGEAITPDTLNVDEDIVMYIDSENHPIRSPRNGLTDDIPERTRGCLSRLFSSVSMALTWIRRGSVIIGLRPETDRALLALFNAMEGGFLQTIVKEVLESQPESIVLPGDGSPDEPIKMRIEVNVPKGMLPKNFKCRAYTSKEEMLAELSVTIRQQEWENRLKESEPVSVREKQYGKTYTATHVRTETKEEPQEKQYMKMSKGEQAQKTPGGSKELEEKPFVKMPKGDQAKKTPDGSKKELEEKPFVKMPKGDQAKKTSGGSKEGLHEKPFMKMSVRELARQIMLRSEDEMLKKIATVDAVRKIADSLEKYGLASKIAIGATGVMGVAGLIAAPFTAGLSLGLTVGFATSVLVTKVLSHAMDLAKENRAQEKLKEYDESVARLFEVLTLLIERNDKDELKRLLKEAMVRKKSTDRNKTVDIIIQDVHNFRIGEMFAIPMKGKTVPLKDLDFVAFMKLFVSPFTDRSAVIQELRKLADSLEAYQVVTCPNVR